MAKKYYDDIFNLLNASRSMAAPMQDAGLLLEPSQIASNLARYQAVPLGAQYMPDAEVNGLSPYQQIMARMAAMQRAPSRGGDGTGGFTNVPLSRGIGGDIGGGSPVITDPTYGIPIFTNPITEPIIPEDENPAITPEEAIKRIEDKVAQEEYDQANQDAIDRIEQAVAEEEYNQSNQDAIYKLEQEVRDENFYNENLNDDELGYLSGNNPEAPPQNEEAPINPTPEELINRDEFGNLDEVIANVNYDQENQDAINRVEEAVRDEALVREDPYGNLEAAIAANALADSARASAIDDATISTSNNTYSGFDPTSANPTIPVEDRIPSPVDEPVQSLLDIGVDPETGVAEDNDAAESIIRDQEALIRDEVRRMSEMMGSNYSDFSYVQPEASYAQPEAQPYVAPYVEPYMAPYVEPYVEPYMAPYIQPEAQPYVEPYVAPYVEPYVAPYVEPYVAPYVEPYVQPEATYVEPYVAPYVEPYVAPYVQPDINQFAGLLNPEVAPESPVFANNPYINPIEAIQAEGLLSPYSEMTSGGGGGGGGYAGNLANTFGDLENADFAANYLLY